MGRRGQFQVPPVPPKGSKLTHSTLRVQPWPCWHTSLGTSPKACGQASLQGHFLPKNFPSREQGEAWGQAQGQSVLQPAHVQRRGPSCPALQCHHRGQDTTDNLQVIGTSLDGGGHWVRGQRADEAAGAGGPGAALWSSVALTQHTQRVQPCVFAHTVPGQAGVRPRVTGLEPLKLQRAAVWRCPA